MKLVFKVTASGITVGDEMVKHTNLTNHTSLLNINMQWQTVKPVCRQTTRDYIIPYLGEALYDDIAGKFDAGTALDPEPAKFLELLQDAVAHYTVHELAKGVNVTVADMGVMQNSSKEGISNPASQWSYKDLLQNTLKKGDDALDRLLTFLEKMVKDEVSYFDLWKTDPAYDFKTSSFFRRTAELDQFINIKASRRSFIALTNYLRTAETRYLLPILCNTTFDDMATKYKADHADLEAYETKLLQYIQRLVANFGLYEAIPHLAISIEDDGFRVISRTDGFEDRRNTTNQEHTRMREALRQKAEEDGRQARAELIAFLYANKDDFPDWVASDCYQDDSTCVRDVIVPSDRRGGIFL